MGKSKTKKHVAKNGTKNGHTKPAKHPASLSPKLEKELQTELLAELSKLDEIDGKARRIGKAFKTLREYHEERVYSARRQLEGYEAPQLEIAGTASSKNVDSQMKTLDVELEAVVKDANDSEKARAEEKKAKREAIEKAGTAILKNAGSDANGAEKREANLGS